MGQRGAPGSMYIGSASEGVFSDLGKRVKDLGGNSLMGCLGWPTCVVGGRKVAQGSLG